MKLYNINEKTQSPEFRFTMEYTGNSEKIRIPYRLAGIVIKRDYQYQFIITMAIILFLFHLSLISASAQSQHDTLSKYIKIAIENNPSIQQKFAEYQAALQKIPQAGALPDPEFNLSYFLMPMELVSGRQFAEMNLMQMFPWFGVLKNAKDEMTSMAFAEFEEYHGTGLQITLQVQNTWYDLFIVRKKIDIGRRNIDILNLIEDIALTRYTSAPSGSAVSPGAPMQNQDSPASGNTSGSSMQGMSVMSGGTGSSNLTRSQQPMPGNQMEQSSGSGLADLYRLKMEYADLENLILSLEDQAKVLAEQLNILLNRDPDTHVFVPDSLIAEISPEDSLLRDLSLSDNPMLAMIEYEKKAYAAREKMISRMGLPMIGLGVGYSVIGKNEMTTGEMSESMGGEDMVMPMVSVTIPVWRKKYRAMRKESEILLESVNHRYESAADNLMLEFNEALRNYRDAQRRLDLYTGQRTLAVNTLELLQTRLSVSSASLTDILRVQQQLLDYETREVEAVADVNKSLALLNSILAISLKDLNLKN